MQALQNTIWIFKKKYSQYKLEIPYFLVILQSHLFHSMAILNAESKAYILEYMHNA